MLNKFNRGLWRTLIKENSGWMTQGAQKATRVYKIKMTNGKKVLVTYHCKKSMYYYFFLTRVLTNKID